MMYRKSVLFTVVVLTAMFSSYALASVYPAPANWWAHMYEGKKASPGGAFSALDGTWSHDNGSDAWDESEIGQGAPGGAMALEEDGTTFLRMQDCGDPRPNPADPSNRKIMFGHSITGDVGGDVAGTVLDTGVTISFRARIPTSGPLDDLNDGGSKTPYPVEGDGYVPHDGGKDNFNVRQSNGDKVISFALCLAADDDELEGRSGLTMNKLNGTTVTGDVDIQGDEPGTVQVLEFDPTQWHEFWITIQADPTGSGTHMVQIYMDGSLEPDVFYVTAGNGDDYSDSYIAMGVGATPQSGALDIDFFGYQPGIYAPDGVFKAGSPSPADGEMAAPASVPLFRWSAGLNGVLHKLYLGTSPELTEENLAMPSMPAMVYYHPPGLEAGQTYYWRVDEIQADGTVTEGDVWSFMTQALTAYYPTPADGAMDVSAAATLTWLPGYGAVTHQVYFSDAFADVNEAAAAADKGIQEETAFTPEDLEGLAMYYWRVDEQLAGGVVKAGPVWSFTTIGSIDDFESYLDDFETGDAIWEVWIDGLTNGTGAIVGNFDPPFAETTIVHGGLQSMPVDYNNIVEPFYSEAELPLAPSQDWTAGGAGVLVLFVRGNSTNDAAPVYVALEDTSGNVHAVTHPDPALATSRDWVRWPIPFSEFADAGVNMARIKTLYIGVGDRENPQADGTGRIYIDDISLMKSE